jgi:hypothetical protein
MLALWLLASTFSCDLLLGCVGVDRTPCSGKRRLIAPYVEQSWCDFVPGEAVARRRDSIWEPAPAGLTPLNALSTRKVVLAESAKGRATVQLRRIATN